MKLTEQELKGYLGTGLKIKDLGRGIIELNINELFYYNNTIGLDKIKPILRPLSDLTKFREDLGFVPIEELAKMFHKSDKEVTHYNNFRFDGIRYSVNCCVNNDDFRYMYFQLNADVLTESYLIIEQLQQWHFDIHGLIEQGLAIDINTLTK